MASFFKEHLPSPSTLTLEPTDLQRRTSLMSQLLHSLEGRKFYWPKYTSILLDVKKPPDSKPSWQWCQFVWEEFSNLFAALLSFLSCQNHQCGGRDINNETHTHVILALVPCIFLLVCIMNQQTHIAHLLVHYMESHATHTLYILFPLLHATSTTGHVLAYQSALCSAVNYTLLPRRRGSWCLRNRHPSRPGKIPTILTSLSDC